MNKKNNYMCNSAECYNNYLKHTKVKNCPLCAYDITGIEKLKSNIKKEFIENIKAKKQYRRLKFAEYSITICFCSLVLGYIAYILIAN